MKHRVRLFIKGDTKAGFESRIGSESGHVVMGYTVFFVRQSLHFCFSF